MNHKQFLALFIILFSANYSVASEEINILNKENQNGEILIQNSEKYETIKNLFDQAPAASEVEVKGWTSGRCYFESNTASAMVLMGVHTSVPSIDGPLFPDEKGLKVVLVQHNNRVPLDYFDVLTPEIETSLTSYLTDKKFNDISEATLIDGSLASVYIHGGISYKIRKNKDYLLAAVVYVDGAGKEIENYSAYSYCYFFKKIK